MSTVPTGPLRCFATISSVGIALERSPSPFFSVSRSRWSTLTPSPTYPIAPVPRRSEWVGRFPSASRLTG